jgi:hypothetical protein
MGLRQGRAGACILDTPEDPYFKQRTLTLEL